MLFKILSDIIDRMGFKNLKTSKNKFLINTMVWYLGVILVCIVLILVIKYGIKKFGSFEKFEHETGQDLPQRAYKKVRSFFTGKTRNSTDIENEKVSSKYDFLKKDNFK